MVLLGWLFVVLSVAGALYMFAAERLVAARAAAPPAQAPSGASPAVTLMKPLHGAEPWLRTNLESFLDQDYDGAVQVVFGVREFGDPAVKVVRELQRAHPAADISLVVDARLHGENRKVSNLINMSAAARHEVAVVSDSDIRVGRDYLRQVVAPLADPTVGFVTALYVGEPSGPAWAALSAAGVNYQFLPNVLMGARLGMAEPCFGATIALRREVLERVGGFGALSDQLADDYDLGCRVRGLGLRGEFAETPVVHMCAERSWRELWRHETRWARTIRLIDARGYAGSAVTHPLGWAAFGCVLAFGPWSLAALALAAAARLHLARRVDRAMGLRSSGPWLVFARDALSFAVFLCAFCGNVVNWGGRRFRIASDGALTPLEEFQYASHPVPAGAFLRRLRRGRGLPLPGQARDPIVLVPDLARPARGLGREQPADRRPAA